MPEQVFSESEAAEIVKFAAKLQEEKSSTAENYTPGVTKDELWRIAQEVGLSKEVFEQAVAEYRDKGISAQAEKRFRLGLEIERVINGELAVEDFDLLTNLLRRRSHTLPPAQVGRTLHTKLMVYGSQADVSVTARNGRTRLEITSSPILGIVFGVQAALMGSIAGAGMIAEGQHLLVGIATVLLSWLTGAGIFSWVARGSRKAVTKLANELEARLKELVAPVPEEETSAQLQERLNADA